MDGGKATFDGPWHLTFYDRPNFAENEEIRAAQTASLRGLEILRKHNLASSKLAETRTFEGITLTHSEMMHIYGAASNLENRAAIAFGNRIPLTVQQKVIEYLPQPFKDAADDLVGELSSDANYARTRLALLDFTDGKEDLGRVEGAYVPMQRTDVTYATTDQELLDELASRKGLKRAFTERGFTKERVTVPPAFQMPIRLGLIEVYFDHAAKREHFIAQGRVVKDLQRLLQDKDVRAAIRQTQGEELLDVIERYVNRIASPSFYKAFGQLNSVWDSARQRAAIVHLGFNVMAYLNQIPSVALFLGEVGPVELSAGIARMTSDWSGTVKFIHERDPQMATRSIERELEELKRIDPARYGRTIGRLSRASLEGLYVLDRFSTHAGWIAKYEQMKRLGASEKEAVRGAQQAVLRTQNAASAKDIADLYAQDSFMNLWLMFTNQVNQMWNQTTYDLPRRVAAGRAGDAALTGIGLAFNAMIIWLVSNGRLPPGPEGFGGAQGALPARRASVTTLEK